MSSTRLSSLVYSVLQLQVVCLEAATRLRVHANKYSVQNENLNAKIFVFLFVYLMHQYHRVLLK